MTEKRSSGAFGIACVVGFVVAATWAQSFLRGPMYGAEKAVGFAFMMALPVLVLAAWFPIKLFLEARPASEPGPKTDWATLIFSGVLWIGAVALLVRFAIFF